MTTKTAIYEEKDDGRPPHRYIQFGDLPKEGFENEAVFLLIDHFLPMVKKSRKRWRRDREAYQINWDAPKERLEKSKQINYLILARHLKTNGAFIPESLNLPNPECFWLDVSFPIKMNFHTHDQTGTLTLSQQIPTQQYGSEFPISPSLQREGHLFGSFQPHLMQRIMKMRRTLIEDSHLAITDEWVFDLRTLINDTISLLDIALNQIYIKAEYDPLPSWTFDKSKLGERHGRRLNDKLKWIYQIVGKPLDIQVERSSLNSLKALRNHLMHFDPPCLVITIEEATEWLNQVVDIGMIIVKIRKTIGVEMSTDLINFLLQKRAVFVPRKREWKRKPLRSEPRQDYASSTWP